MLKFCIKVFKIILSWIYFLFGMIIDITPKFYSKLSLTYNLQVKVMDLKKFYVKVLPQSSEEFLFT